jgi:hypothetical protein
LAGYAILAGRNFLPGPFSGPEAEKAAIAGVIARVVAGLTSDGFLVDCKPLEGDEYRSWYAATDKLREFFGFDILQISLWNGGGEEIPFGEAQFLSKLAVIFEDALDIGSPREFRERAMALIGRYIDLGKDPPLEFVFP